MAEKQKCGDCFFGDEKKTDLYGQPLTDENIVVIPGTETRCHNPFSDKHLQKIEPILPACRAIKSK